MEKVSDKPECATEALDLLNCITQSPFDQQKCVALMSVLRECVLNKKVKNFSLADMGQQESNPASKQA